MTTSSTTDTTTTATTTSTPASKSPSLIKKKARRWPFFLPTPGVLFSVLSLVCSLMLYAVSRDRLMTTPYTNGFESSFDEPGIYFEHSFILILLNRMVITLFAFFILCFHYNNMKLKAPIYKYILLSAMNMINTILLSETLKITSVEIQTVSTCMKFMSVIFSISLLSSSKQNIKKKMMKYYFIIAFTITFGTTLFLYSGLGYLIGIYKKNSIHGLILMCIYLFIDGLTFTYQEKLFRDHEKMTIFNQLFYINFLSTLCFSIPSIVFFTKNNTNFFETIQFIKFYPSMRIELFMVVITSIIAQITTVHTIHRFGALFYAAVMSSRQSMSIFVTNIIFGHPIAIVQYIGIFVTILGLCACNFVNRRVDVAVDGDVNDMKIGIVSSTSSSLSQVQKEKRL